MVAQTNILDSSGGRSRRKNESEDVFPPLDFSQQFELAATIHVCSCSIPQGKWGNDGMNTWIVGCQATKLGLEGALWFKVLYDSRTHY